MLKEVGEGDEVNYILLESEWLYRRDKQKKNIYKMKLFLGNLAWGLLNKWKWKF